MNLLDEGGTRPEKRFFRALSKIGKAPDWLHGIEQTIPFIDVKRLDALALVSCPFKWQLVRVAIQVKGSQYALDEYFDSHPRARQLEVIGIVIKQTDEDKHIRKIVCKELDVARWQKRDHTPYLIELLSMPLGERGRKLEQKIIAERKKILWILSFSDAKAYGAF